MSVIFVDSERIYVHDVVGNFVIGQIAISCTSWQDYAQFSLKMYVHAQIM